MQTPVMPNGVETCPPTKLTSGPRQEHALDLSRIAQDLQIRKVQVESVVALLDEGNTVPFITRYRKERTGGLNEEVIRQIQARVNHLRQLAERKQTILKSVEGQGKLTDELRHAILAADTSKRLEDLYLPYKPKKRTAATIARERGLEGLAQAIWNRDPAVANLHEVLPGMVNAEKGLNTPEDVLLGVQHILAEQIAETADVRAAVRSVLWETGKLCTAKSDNVPEGQGLEYKDYFQFTETVRHIPPHRILAINRGEKEGPLKGRLEWNAEAVQRVAFAKLPLTDHPHADFLKKVAEDALARLLLPSLEREIRRELTDEAEEHAVRVFARNLRSLLLQPPLRGRRVLAIDPGFRTGCKLAALDEVGNLLEDAVVFPYAKSESAKGKGPVKGPTEKGGVEKSESQPSPVPPPLPDEQASAIPPSSQASLTAATASTEPSAVQVAPPTLSPEPMLPVPQPSPEPGAGVLASSPQPLATGPVKLLDSIVPAPLPTQYSVPSTRFIPEPDASSPAADSATAALTPNCQVLAPESPVRNPRHEAKAKLEELIHKHQLNVIAIGNGTACRETEELVSELIAERLPELAYVIVNEAGASVYSTSAVGREEFPQFDATLRGTISIGRRLQDPLSELVKIDPQSIGVGLYQHDIHPRRLKDSLDAVIESCVNHVGVDLNTASVPLLRHVSGLNQLAARELADYRKQHGAFKNRDQLLQVPGIGPNRFVQAAGFLKVMGGDNLLDQTWIHPESYPAAQRLLSELGCGVETLHEKHAAEQLQQKVKSIPIDELGNRLEVGIPTLHDIVEALARPGRDPREDLPAPIFKKGILKLEDLQAGMELKGTVLNVVDFGAFVDIGLKDSGLVHISQMANRYIKNPYDVASVGDVVTVWVLAVDQERRRVSLTMIKPGTERKAPEKKPAEPRSQRGGRPQRGRRPPPPKRQPVAAPGAEQTAAPAAQENAAGVATVAKDPPRQPPRGTSPPPRPPARPRKPYREPPKPKLSKAALEGAAPLRTFSELKAFFEAQQQPAVPKPATEEASNESARTAQ